MEAILMSIKPEYVLKILSGEKTVEIRKTKPKCELPIDVYIYCTKSNKEQLCDLRDLCELETPFQREPAPTKPVYAILDENYKKVEKYKANGKIVAKFTLKSVSSHSHYGVSEYHDVDLKSACLTLREFAVYIGFNTESYAWHISDLVVFDVPMELKEFRGLCEMKNEVDMDSTFLNCNVCKSDKCHVLTRAPQSWQYVEVDE